MKQMEKRIFVISTWPHGFQALYMTLGSNEKKVKYLKIFRCGSYKVNF